MTECGAEATWPHPRFPNDEFLVVTHVCGKAPGHLWVHKCRKCGAEWADN